MPNGSEVRNPAHRFALAAPSHESSPGDHRQDAQRRSPRGNSSQAQ